LDEGFGGMGRNLRLRKRRQAKHRQGRNDAQNKAAEIHFKRPYKITAIIIKLQQSSRRRRRWLGQPIRHHQCAMLVNLPQLLLTGFLTW
jgi:hypothetical protein